jgi:hypothetical protein
MTGFPIGATVRPGNQGDVAGVKGLGPHPRPGYMSIPRHQALSESMRHHIGDRRSKLAWLRSLGFSIYIRRRESPSYEDGVEITQPTGCDYPPEDPSEAACRHVAVVGDPTRNTAARSLCAYPCHSSPSRRRVWEKKLASRSRKIGSGANITACVKKLCIA